jgi:hypothetical protein
MRDKLILVLAIFLAIFSWWGLYEYVGMVQPDEPGALTFFYAVLFLALTATLAPLFLFLNRRFAPVAYARDPWRLLRHSAWGGLCLSSWAWLQMERTLNFGFALVIALIFVAIELLILRLRSEPE